MREKLIQNIAKKVNVLNYQDYISFLEDVYMALKQSIGKYTHKEFSRDLGFNNDVFIHLVLKGKRNIGPKTKEILCKTLQFGKHQRNHFSNIVDIKRRKEVDNKSDLYKKVVVGAGRPGFKHLDKKLHKFYSHWYIPAVRALVEMEDFQENPHWIANKIHPNITASQAQEALKILQDLKLIERGKLGKLQLTDNIIKTSKEVNKRLSVVYYNELLNIALNSIESVPAMNRDFGSLILGIDEETFTKVKKEVADCQQKILDHVERSKTGTRIFNFCYQLFPLTVANATDTKEETNEKT